MNNIKNHLWLISPLYLKEVSEQTSKKLEAKTDGDSFKPVFSEKVNGVGVVYISGIFYKGANALLESYGYFDPNKVKHEIENLINDPTITHIILKINSPGGAYTGVPELSDYLMNARKIKPIMAYTDTLLASAAYWVAVSTLGIYASKSSDVGSIGVYTTVYDTSKAYEQMGVSVQVFKGGKFKAAGIDGTSLNDEQRDEIQKEIDLIYEQFKSYVLLNRGNVMDESLQGQTMLAIKARQANLIDSVASLEQLIEDIQKI